jgi:membrane protease subunit HflC
LKRTLSVRIGRKVLAVNVSGSVVAALILAGLFVAYDSTFTVHQTQQALVVRLGRPVGIVTTAGLHFKLPLIDNVVEIDNRIIDLESPEQEVIGSDQKRLVINAFARYKIVRPLEFYQAVNSIDGANARLLTLLNSAIRRVFGQATLIDVVRNERSVLMAQVLKDLEAGAQSFGNTVVDVRIRRAVLPEQNSQAVYHRMQTERQREAAGFRAVGSERAQTIRAVADREVAIIVANATANGERLRGEGDGERNRIFGKAFGRDAEFAAFYRSMQAYEAGLGHSELVLSLTSPFFDHFNSPWGHRPAGVQK